MKARSDLLEIEFRTFSHLKIAVLGLVVTAKIRKQAGEQWASVLSDFYEINKLFAKFNSWESESSAISAIPLPH